MCEDYGVVQLSTGDILRANRKAGTELDELLEIDVDNADYAARIEGVKDQGATLSAQLDHIDKDMGLLGEGMAGVHGDVDEIRGLIKDYEGRTSEISVQLDELNKKYTVTRNMIDNFGEEYVTLQSDVMSLRAENKNIKVRNTITGVIALVFSLSTAYLLYLQGIIQ